MSLSFKHPVPILRGLPATMPRVGGIEIEMEQGVLIFRVASAVQERIETLLRRQREAKLTAAEAQELDQYEEMDDYLSFINRLLRNLAQAQQTGSHSAA